MCGFGLGHCLTGSSDPVACDCTGTWPLPTVEGTCGVWRHRFVVYSSTTSNSIRGVCHWQRNCIRGNGIQPTADSSANGESATALFLNCKEAICWLCLIQARPNVASVFRKGHRNRSTRSVQCNEQAYLKLAKNVHDALLHLYFSSTYVAVVIVSILHVAGGQTSTG